MERASDGFRVARAGGDSTSVASFDTTASSGLELDICPRITSNWKTRRH